MSSPIDKGFAPEYASDLRVLEIQSAAELLMSPANLCELTGPQFEGLLRAVRTFDRDMLNEDSLEDRAHAR
jgi:hypothetical protein